MEKCLRSRYQGPIVEKNSMVQHSVYFVLLNNNAFVLFLGLITYLLDLSGSHLEDEKVFVGLINIAVDVLEIANPWQPIVYIWIAFFFNFVQTRILSIGNVQTYVLLVEALHHSLREVWNFFYGYLPDWTFVDCSLKPWWLYKLVDNIEGPQGEQLLRISILILDLLIKDILNGRTHEAFCIIGAMLLIHDQELNQRRYYRQVELYWLLTSILLTLNACGS